jgi:SAM-dependent methyltransferase
MKRDAYSPLSEGFVAHLGSLRGRVRFEVVSRQLDDHLAQPAQHVVDIGGGNGMQAIRLALKGHRTEVVDPSADMMRRAREALAHQPKAVRDRVGFVAARGEEAPALLGRGGFDAVLCHGVLMYLPDPRPLIEAIVSLARPGGLISVLTKNASSLAMRPALTGKYTEALEALDSDRTMGRLGVTTRGDTLDHLRSLLSSAGAEMAEWYGVRVATDHREDPPEDDEEVAPILELEYRMGAADPYRAVAPLLHVVATRRTEGQA